MGYMMRKMMPDEFRRYVQTLKNASENELMYAVIAAICIGIGARIGEVLRLRLRDIINPDGSARTEIVRSVEKKRRVDLVRCAFPVEVFGDIVERHAARQILCHGAELDDFAFSRRRHGKPVHHLSAWLHNRKFLQSAAVPVCGVGFHGLRKTFLTTYFQTVHQKTGDMYLALSATQKVAGHESFGTTTKYITAAIEPPTEETQREIWAKM